MRALIALHKMNNKDQHTGTPSPSVTFGDVEEIVGLQLGRAAVRPEDDLYGDLGAESMDLVNLAVAVEDRFGVFIPEEDLATLRTVEDVYRLVVRLLAASPPEAP